MSYYLKINLYFLLQTCVSIYSNANNIKGLDDSILFRINWPGKDDGLLESPDYEQLEMTTVNNEKFQCLVPHNYGDTIENDDGYAGPNALELLMPLFKKKICTLRLETFWTYELCHGQWIKQYHEGREESTTRHQDYSLGVTNLKELEKLNDELKVSLAEHPGQEVPQTKLEGVDMPYFPVTYSGGTPCDLTGNPRKTRVLYVCYEEGRHALYSIKETYTCEYDIIVLTSLLCEHPSYKAQEVPQTNLHCIPMQEGTKRPTNLIRIEAESLKLRTHGTALGGDLSGGSVRIEVLEPQENNAEVVPTLQAFLPEDGRVRKSPFPPHPSIDKKLVEDFLNGDYCLHGGAGWWKYEFCYGKDVRQYHESKDGSRYSILLGVFHMEQHKQWLKENPSKVYREGRQRVSHLYTGGDYCDEIGQGRQVEVRLKCRDGTSQTSVALYLIEPKTCEYVLGVETPLICPLLANADENGLFTITDPNEWKDPQAKARDGDGDSSFLEHIKIIYERTNEESNREETVEFQLKGDEVEGEGDAVVEVVKKVEETLEEDYEGQFVEEEENEEEEDLTMEDAEEKILL